jgi:cell division protein FtsW (lipid II flippase)
MWMDSFAWYLIFIVVVFFHWNTLLPSSSAHASRWIMLGEEVRCFPSCGHIEATHKALKFKKNET